jgi:pyruvate dehydrogenase E1 component beta subunit
MVMPSTPYDAKGLLKAAIRENNPVLFWEHKQLYRQRGPVPEGDYTVPIGRAEVKREGKDATVIAIGFMVDKALRAADFLAKEGLSVEVLDPRTILPLDKETIIGSVAKTRRVVIVHEAPKTGGIGAEIAAIIVEDGFGYLAAPIKRVAAPDVPVPRSQLLEKEYLPNEEKIMAAVKSLF